MLLLPHHCYHPTLVVGGHRLHNLAGLLVASFLKGLLEYWKEVSNNLIYNFVYITAAFLMMPSSQSIYITRTFCVFKVFVVATVVDLELAMKVS